MRNRLGTLLLVVLPGSLVLVGAAEAQSVAPAALPRWDVAAHVDLFSSRYDAPARCCDEWSHVFAGGGGLGFYWTPNLKTEIDVTAGDEDDLFVTEQVAVPGVAFPAYRAGRRQLQHTTLAAGQVYQFYRNAWFHPTLGTGVDLQWKRSSAQFDPLRVYRSDARVSEVIEPALTVPSETNFRARPFVITGFKGYFTERAFFRMDFKLVPAGATKQVTWRAGLGVDF